MTAKTSEVGNQALAEALLAEGATLGPGAQPEVEASTEDGKKAMFEALSNASTAVLKEKKQNKGKKDPAERAEPKTVLEWGTQTTHPVLRKSDIAFD